MTYSLGCQFSEFAPSQQNPYSESLASSGGERGPVTFPAFKAGDAFLRGTGGGFDFHTPPPNLLVIQRFDVPGGWPGKRGEASGTDSC